MPSSASRVLLQAIRLSNFFGGDLNIGRQRAVQERMDLLVKTPRDVVCTPLTRDGLPLAKLSPVRTVNAGLVALHLHGGAYVSGGARYCQAMGARIACHLGLDVLSVVYRLAPEHPYPAALDDAFTAFCSLLDDGYKPSDILIVGESAGAGLSLALMSRLKEAGLGRPRGLYLMSPWVDLTCQSDSYSRNVETDPSLRIEHLRMAAAMYANGHPLQDPHLSPLYGSHFGLPPTLIQSGDIELLQDEAHAMALALRRDGVEVRYQVLHGMWHCFQAFDVPEARAAFQAAKDFFQLL